MTIGKYTISKETMWGVGILLAVGVVVFYNRNKNNAQPVANTAIPQINPFNYSSAYKHAVEVQIKELNEQGTTKINLADPTTWPVYK